MCNCILTTIEYCSQVRISSTNQRLYTIISTINILNRSKFTIDYSYGSLMPSDLFTLILTVKARETTFWFLFSIVRETTLQEPETCETTNFERYRFRFLSRFWRSNGSDTDSSLDSGDPTVPIPIPVLILEIQRFRVRFQVSNPK